jgi:hypothetical protein
MIKRVALAALGYLWATAASAVPGDQSRRRRIHAAGDLPVTRPFKDPATTEIKERAPMSLSYLSEHEPLALTIGFLPSGGLGQKHRLWPPRPGRT